jgi:uncharacterized protein
MRSLRLAPIGFLLLLLLSATTAHAAPPTPKLSDWVNDEAHVLNAQQVQQLTDFLKSQEEQTSNQIVILTIDSLNGEDIESFSIRAARAARIGQKKNANGVLLVAAIKDRRMRIEAGQGLEGVLTDALSSEIIRNEIAPSFKAGDYFGGLWAGVHAINKAIHGEYKGTGRQRQHAPTIDVGTLLFWMIFFIVILASHVRFRRYRNHWLGPVWIPNPSSGFGSSSSSGGGFFDGGGGGGGGGFSGGGGSFGGGGASGGW